MKNRNFTSFARFPVKALILVGCGLCGGCVSLNKEVAQAYVVDSMKNFLPDVALVSAAAVYYNKSGRWPEQADELLSGEENISLAFKSSIIVTSVNDKGNFLIWITPRQVLTAKNNGASLFLPRKRTIEVSYVSQDRKKFAGQYIGDSKNYKGTIAISLDENK